jgi:EmrB/QacA subfamily drug resistance transporter
MSITDAGTTDAGTAQVRPVPGSAGPAPAEPEPNPRRWRALTALALVQFMVVVDATIVNVALPSIQRTFVASNATLSWVVGGYALTASTLVLLGGRTADLFGRRRVFMIALSVFGAASLTCGIATSMVVLVIGRFAQGGAEAFVGPAAMSLMVLQFNRDHERAKAFAIWGSLAGVGAVAGVLMSGAITSFLSWRWIFLINVAFVGIPLLLVPRLMDESRAESAPRRIDVRSALLLTLGLVLLVQGVLAASHDAWTAVPVAVPVLAGGVVLGLFGMLQQRLTEPLVPLSFFRNRARLAANASAVFLASTSTTLFFLLVLYMQNVLRFTPWQTGLAWLPFCAAFMPGLMLSVRLMRRIGDRHTVAVGLGVAAGGLLLFTRITTGGPFLTELAPAMVITALGFGMANPALQSAVLSGVTSEDAGVASGLTTTVMQLGGALGLAVFVTLSTRQGAAGVHGMSSLGATTHGYRVAFGAAAATLLIGAVLTPVMHRRVKTTPDVRPAAAADGH